MNNENKSGTDVEWKNWISKIKSVTWDRLCLYHPHLI